MLSRNYCLLSFSLFMGIFSFGQSTTVLTGPTLGVPRTSHEMQPLPDGKMLIMGGEDGNLLNPFYYKSCEIYDPVSKQIGQASDMQVPRSGFTSAVLNDGNILIAGGNNDQNYALRSCEIFDVASQSWSFTDSLKVHHLYSTSIKLNDGRVLVAGGRTVKSEVYDSYTKTWSYTADMVFEHGAGMSLTLLPNGQVLAVGGDIYTRAIEIFSPNSNSWTKLISTTNYSHLHHAALLLPDGRVLIAGSSGFNINDQVSSEIVNPTTGYSTNAGNLITPLSDAEMVLLDNGKVLTLGIGDTTSHGNTKIIQEFDPSSGTWATSSYSSIGVQEYAMGRLPNGTIFVAGGNSSNGNGASHGTWYLQQNGYSNCLLPDSTLQFTVDTSQTCYGKALPITLHSTESSITYHVFLGETEVGSLSGTGTSKVPFSISANYLVPGLNRIRLSMSKLGCQTVKGKYSLLVNDPLKNLTIPKIAFKNGNPLICYDTSKATVQILDPGTGSFLWYNGSRSNETQATASTIARAQSIDEDGCLGLPSEGLDIRKLASSDLFADHPIKVCETAPSIQLNASPLGGTWSGAGVTSSGLFTPSQGTIGAYALFYSICSYTAYQDVEVQALNKVTFAESNIQWPLQDTLCGGLTYVVNVNSTNDYRFKLLANDSLILSFVGNNFAYPTYTPHYDTSVTLFYQIKKTNLSSLCPMDSLILSKKYKVAATPEEVAVVIPDTACLGWPITLKVVKPQKGVLYYATFFPEWLENEGPMRSVATDTDTLLITSNIVKNSTSNLVTAYAISSRACASANVSLGSNEVQTKTLVTTLSLGSVYYTGEKVAPKTVSNANYFQWKIDSIVSIQMNAPEKTYSDVGNHHYQLIAVSQFGCSDTLDKEISIRKKASLGSEETCLFDTCQISFNNQVFKSIEDKKGNLVFVGQYKSNVGGASSGSNNAFIDKYDAKNGEVIWSLSHNPSDEPYDFNSMMITGVSVDDNNDLYITGSYFSTIIHFGGITISHPESTRPYGHAFVAKISESGSVKWFISSYYPTYTDIGGYEIGGADIDYANGKLFVSARLLSQYYWKNQEGQTFTMENTNTEYSILMLDTNGSNIQVLAGIGNGNNSYAIDAMYSPNSGYNTGQIAILEPQMQVMKNGKLTVSGLLRGAINFGNTTITPPVLSTSGTTYTEFTGVVDPIVKGWENVQLGSSTNSLAALDKDKVAPLALYTQEMDKLSAVNIISDIYQPFQSPAIQINSQESVSYFGRAALVHVTNKNGQLVWKRLLQGATITNLYMSLDETQLIAVGAFQYGVSLLYGDINYGINNSQTMDLFAMGFNVSTGDLLWAEKIGSKNLDDHPYASALTSCNDLILMGYRTQWAAADVLDPIWHEKDSIFYLSDFPYILRIPLSGACYAQNCSAPASLSLEEVIPEENGSLVYPNPALSSVWIKSEDRQPCQKMVLKDLNGKILSQQDFPSGEETMIDISTFSTGIYFVEGIFANKKIIHKICIRR